MSYPSSTPLWIAYWAVGWQVMSTQYCFEIESILRQMLFLYKKISVLMPQNGWFFEQYLDIMCRFLTPLLDIERNESTSLWEHFKPAVKKQEDNITGQLRDFSYCIDTKTRLWTVIGDRHIERVRLTTHSGECKLKIISVYLYADYCCPTTGLGQVPFGMLSAE
jgi:hypothetical protein